MCEQLRRTYEEKVREDPKDGKAYLALGQVLMELGSMHQDEDALIMTKDAVGAFQKCIDLDDKCHEAMWHIGNAHLILAFNTKGRGDQEVLIEKSREHYTRALTVDPENDRYKTSIEALAKMPEYLEAMQSQEEPEIRPVSSAAGPSGRGAVQGGRAGGSGGSSRGPGASAGKKSATPWYLSETFFDYGGWVCLAGCVAAYILMVPKGPAAIPQK